MNQTIKDIYNRKSVRVFRDESITDEEKRIILESALQAPTAGNMTLYSIIDVQDQELKNKLADLCDHQPFIKDAPLVLLFVADYQRWYDLFQHYCTESPKLDYADLILAGEDCMIAAQNAVVAAQSLGIGSCYIGDILENYEVNRELFNLPQYVLPYILLVFGKPTQQQMDREKPKRFALEDIVYQNQYKQKNIDELTSMIQNRIHKDDIESYVQAFAKRKFYAEFREEMNRSVRVMLDSWMK